MFASFSSLLVVRTQGELLATVPSQSLLRPVQDGCCLNLWGNPLVDGLSSSSELVGHCSLHP